MAGLEGFLKMALNNTQLTDSTIARPGGEGTKSALITSKVTFGIKANGNLTTGRINAGSMDVKSPYNSNISDPTADDRFKCPFYGTPDSLAVWVKYRPANGDIDTAVNVAGIKAIIHNNGVYQDPEDSIMRIDSSFVENVELAKTDTILDTTMIAKYDTVKVAQAITNYKAVEGYEWQRISVPFEYFDDDVYTHKDSAQWIIVSFSTNVTPGGGTAKGKVVDSIFVDDLSLIYNQAHLTQLSVGEEVVNLVDGTYEYTVKQPFNDTTLVITAAAEGAEGASVVTAFDRLTERALVIVKGGDYSVNPASAQCYTINFTKPTPAGVDNAGTGAVVYTEGMMLHIESETAEMAMIYATNGKLVATTTAKTYMLPYAGVWFVRIGNETYKVLAL